MSATNAYMNTGTIKKWSRQGRVKDAEKQRVLGRPKRRESPNKARVNQKVGHSRLLTNSLVIPNRQPESLVPGPDWDSADQGAAD